MSAERDANEAYIAGFEGIAKERLFATRAVVLAALPGASERVSYKMLGYFLGKRAIVYLASYKQHVGLYPMPAGDEAFQAELAPYFSGASTVRFPHNRPLPIDLIAKIVAFRVREQAADGA